VHVAGLIYVAATVPVLFASAPPLASHLTASEVTRSLLVPALRWIPLAALAAMPFFLCRPVFEGLGRGKPGLVMSVLRYGLLAAPAAWLGLRAGALSGVSGFLGLVFGLVAAAAASSVVFLLWTGSALRQAEASAQNPSAAA